MNLIIKEIQEELEYFKTKTLKLGEQEGKEFDKCAEKLARFTLLLVTADTSEQREQYTRDIEQVKTSLALMSAISSIQAANKIIEATWSIALKIIMRILIV